MNLCVIPARGGSKRIPRKNIREFCGKPMISYSIAAAIDSELFDIIMVSTDDDEIAKVAIDFGAEVPFLRSRENSDDYTGTGDVMYEVISEYESRGASFAAACCLYATAPLRSYTDLQAMNRIFLDNSDCKAVVAVTSFSHYPHQAFELYDDGKISSFWPELASKKRDELPTFVAGNGSSYAINVKEFLQIGDFYADKMTGLYSYYMPPARSIDIDDIDDYNLLLAILGSSD